MATITIASAVHHPSIMRALSGMCGIAYGDACRGQAYRQLVEALPLRQLRDWTADDLVEHYLIADEHGRLEYRSGMGGARGVSAPAEVTHQVRLHDGTWLRMSSCVIRQIEQTQRALSPDVRRGR